MGLDMYLNRMPRYKDATADTVSTIESYLGYDNDIKNPDSNARSYTMEEWCGVDESEVPESDDLNFYKQFYKAYYSDWDTEHQHPWMRIHEEVGYWRKANQIHQWFVDNVQDGVDDCNYHDEVTKEKLEELLDICKEVLDGSELVEGMIENGYRYENGVKTPIMQSGKYIKDPNVAKNLLPAQEGFFFGGTNYDQYYLSDIQNTIDIITKVLETTDFETEMVYYVSSW